MDQSSWTRPDFSSEQALRIADERFQILAHRAEPLPSDRDQNFLLHDQATHRRFVLKISNTGEDLQALDFQNRILEHLARGGFPCPHVLFDRHGEEIASVSHESGAEFPVRILTWLPGRRLSDVNPQSPSLLRSVGAFLGGMDRALEGFSHPAQDRRLKWDLRRAGEVVESHLGYVDDSGQRDLLTRLSRAFLRKLDPVQSELRLGVIHGDGNDHNILVREPAQPSQDPAVTGILDFGDAARSYVVGEAAIAGAYSMLSKGDPLAAAGNVVGGYHQALPLEEAEVEALFPLMGLRLCTSVAISSHQKRREPGNPYLIVSEKPAWDLLRSLEEVNLNLPTLLFREACGMAPLPAASRVVTWLEGHGKDAHPVVGRRTEGVAEPERDRVEPLDLSQIPVHILDLGLDSWEFPNPPAPDDAEAWSSLIFQRLSQMGADVGVGRYDEVRSWYTSSIFRAPLVEPEEWRTVHVGIDLFAAPGTPVMAPFDAVVHSVANNAGNLDYGPTVVLEHRCPGSPGEDLTFWTLYGHLGEEGPARLEPGQALAAGEAFGRIGDYPSNGNWAPHLHFQVVTNLLDLEGNFPGVALPSRRSLWKALSPDPNLILNIPDLQSGREEEHGSGHPRPVLEPRSFSRSGPARPGIPSGGPLSPKARTISEILDSRTRILGPNLSVAYGKPLKIVRGVGQHLFDHEGQRYLDCVNNVPHVGHSHPRVVEAARAQMAILNTNTRYLHDHLVEYADRLTALLPDPLSVVYFVCSGSEANELALRMARTHTGRKEVLVVEGAYHGNTSAMVDMSPYKFDGPGGDGQQPWVHQTFMPDSYRGRFRARGPDDGEAVGYLPPGELGERYAEDVGATVSALAEENRGVAAFFCESMLGCGGQIVLPDGYLDRAFQYVRDSGGVCVADEVQVGFGRVGTHFWAFQTQGVVPDIVTLGKPMGNGHPLAAVVTTPEIARSFETGMEYFNTYGGNPVSCAVGLAVLDVLEEEGLQENARRVGAHLLQGLGTLKTRHPVIGDVRGLGLYIGVELVEDPIARIPSRTRASRAKERLREHRILLSTDGPHENVLKIKPPLVFTLEDADHLMGTLDRVLQEDGIRLPQN